MFDRYRYQPQHGPQFSGPDELAKITGPDAPKSMDAIPSGITMGARMIALEGIIRNYENPEDANYSRNQKKVPKRDASIKVLDAQTGNRRSTITSPPLSWRDLYK